MKFYDEKILPKGIVRERANERIKQVEQAAGHRLKKIERVAIAEQVLVDLARTALVKTAIITAFYSTKDQLLIVPVGSKNLANIVTSRLVHVVGSLKTSTIHISNIKNGLTTRLKKHAEGVDPACFDGFEVGASVALKKESQKVSYSIADLDTASQGLLEAIERGFEVERLALEHNGVEFKLTSDFHFKAVKFADDAEHDAADERDEVFMWRQDAAAQVLMFSCVLNQLCDLLGYKADEDEQAEQAAEA